MAPTCTGGRGEHNMAPMYGEEGGGGGGGTQDGTHMYRRERGT